MIIELRIEATLDYLLIHRFVGWIYLGRVLVHFVLTDAARIVVLIHLGRYVELFSQLLAVRQRLRIRHGILRLVVKRLQEGRHLLILFMALPSIFLHIELDERVNCLQRVLTSLVLQHAAGILHQTTHLGHVDLAIILWQVDGPHDPVAYFIIRLWLGIGVSQVAMGAYTVTRPIQKPFTVLFLTKFGVNCFPTVAQRLGRVPRASLHVKSVVCSSLLTVQPIVHDGFLAHAVLLHLVKFLTR